MMIHLATVAITLASSILATIRPLAAMRGLCSAPSAAAPRYRVPAAAIPLEASGLKFAAVFFLLIRGIRIRPYSEGPNESSWSWLMNPKKNRTPTRVVNWPIFLRAAAHQEQLVACAPS
jgi:hypothetical protein